MNSVYHPFNLARSFNDMDEGFFLLYLSLSLFSKRFLLSNENTNTHWQKGYALRIIINYLFSKAPPEMRAVVCGTHM